MSSSSSSSMFFGLDNLVISAFTFFGRILWSIFLTLLISNFFFLFLYPGYQIRTFVVNITDIKRIFWSLMRLLQVAYYLVKTMVKYIYYQSTDADAMVVFNWPPLCRVGETVSFKICVLKNSTLKLEEKKKWMEEFNIEIKHKGSLGDRDGTISYMKEYINTPEESSVTVKFSVRTSGDYRIQVLSNLKHIRGSPFTKTFAAGVLDSEKTEFLRPSPRIMIVTFEDKFFYVRTKDKFENICEISKGELKNFDFDIEYADGQFMPKKICKHEFRKTPQGVRFTPSFTMPGFFRGQITYNNKRIVNGNFDIVVISNAEAASLDKILHNDPVWKYHEAKLLATGSGTQKGQKIYIYVGPKQLYIRDYLLKFIPLKIATFRVYPMTKIDILLTNLAEHTHTMSFSDGVQPKVVVEMNTVSARRVVAMFSHFMTKRLGGSESFAAKQKCFYEELRAQQKDFRMSLTVVRVNRTDLVGSSLRQTKRFMANDWRKNFTIEFSGELGVDGGGLKREWLNLLCTKFFEHNPKGLFASLGNSRLVHPNPAENRTFEWSIKQYELAGKIVGKCLFESSVGSSSTQMVNGRFTRSFLAQVLGLPPNYKHFENDDPELYMGKIKYILENDVELMELTFTEEEYNKSGKLLKVVDLVPNGSKLKVTESNKENYLQQLAYYKLCTKVKKEIEAFLRGLHEIVPDELLANFDENELELLWCGKSQFNLEDLQANYAQGSFLIDPAYKKVLDWFWMAISGMSDDEKAKLLQFTTGSSLLPHGGFKSLNPRFKISLSHEYGHLPIAHTCVNEICLSDNTSFENFEKCLKVAINEGNQGFEFR